MKCTRKHCLFCSYFLEHVFPGGERLLYISYLAIISFSRASVTNQNRNKPLRALKFDWLITARADAPFVVSHWKNAPSLKTEIILNSRIIKALRVSTANKWSNKMRITCSTDKVKGKRKQKPKRIQSRDYAINPQPFLQLFLFFFHRLRNEIRVRIPVSQLRVYLRD